MMPKALFSDYYNTQRNYTTAKSVLSLVLLLYLLKELLYCFTLLFVREDDCHVYPYVRISEDAEQEPERNFC